jgi:hypothetical protein
MEEEKVSGKMLAAWEYIIPVPPCPTSLEEYIAKRKKCLNDFNAEYGTKYSKEPEQKNKTVSKREAP